MDGPRPILILALLLSVAFAACGDWSRDGRSTTPAVDALQRRVAEIRRDVEAARELAAPHSAASERLARASLGLRRLSEYYLPLLAARQHLARAREALDGGPGAVHPALDSVDAALQTIARRHGPHLEGEMREPLEWLQDARTALGAADTAALRRYLDRLDSHLESIYFRGKIVLEGSELERR